jgi:hypothetical protein
MRPVCETLSSSNFFMNGRTCQIGKGTMFGCLACTYVCACSAGLGVDLGKGAGHERAHVVPLQGLAAELDAKQLEHAHLPRQMCHVR